MIEYFLIVLNYSCKTNFFFFLSPLSNKTSTLNLQNQSYIFMSTKYISNILELINSTFIKGSQIVSKEKKKGITTQYH